MAVVVKDRTCRQCGAVFPGGPRAWYCPDCREVRKREANAKYRKAGRKPQRQLGSTDHCTRCGKEYVVNSARQRYCKDCAYDAIREADRPASRAWNQANKDTYYPDRNAKRRKPRYCIICGAPITATTAAITCGNPSCKQERMRQNQRASYAKRHGKPPPPDYTPTKRTFRPG